MADEVWYYYRDGEQQGPVSFEMIGELLANGELSPDDLVWEQNMKEWAPARSVPGLVPGELPGPPPVPSPPPVGGAPRGQPLTARGKALLHSAAERTRRLHEAEEAIAAMPHLRLVKALLDFLKKAISEKLLDAIDRNAKKVGNLAYVAAALLFVLLFLILAIRIRSFQPVLMAVGIAVATVLGHYVAVLFLDAGTSLIRKAPSELSSRAFLLSFGLLASVGAVVCLFLGMFQLGGAGGLIDCGIMVGACLVLLYAGGVALSPSSVNVTVGEEAGAGEEAIGILMFLLKLPLRLVPFMFGVGTVVGVGAACYFLVLAFTDQFAFLPIVALPVAGAVLALALLPLNVYLAFLLLYLLVDVIRAVLLVPVKLEGLGKAETKAES
ncbi:MAG: DUF4339 domain-containing protein [bacterium]|nr:DUF4339 domain-containing protein [bacterium]